MCKYFSAIVTKNKVLWDSEIDSHMELLDRFKIKDDIIVPTFVKVEIVPSFYTIEGFSNLTKWKFSIDQDILPKWVNEKDIEYRTREELLEYAKTFILINQNREVQNGRYFCFTSIVKAYDSSIVEVCGFSSVKAYDSSIIKDIKNNTISIPNNLKVIVR